MRQPDPGDDLIAASVMAVVTFLVFAALLASLITKSFTPVPAAWVGAGLVGLGAALLAAWAAVIQFAPSLGWAERFGGDLLLVGFGVFFVAAGLPTFAAAVL
jgi:hypothetical protein